jgi:formylglycine-generating enzyme required for sulfatase activity
VHQSPFRALRLHAPVLIALSVAMLINVPATAAPRPPSSVPTQKEPRVFKDCTTCPEMVVVPAGEFIMGSPDEEAERLSYESPRHLVKIAVPFAVGRFAVTFDEWDTCVAEGGCRTTIARARAYDEGWGRGRRPVINVSWYDAKDYVSWLSRKTGKEYRLLSEAEREYVTRAGTTTTFWWGKSMSPVKANYMTLYSYNGGETSREYAHKTLPVDSFAPNPWGLYQVHGNIMEWVEDCWHENYEGAPADGSAWVSGDCKFRAERGGAWWLLPQHLRSAARFYSEPNCCVVPERETARGANSLRVARRL